MNKVVLIGRLTKDPELKFTPGTGTAVTTCTLAVDRRFSSKEGQKEADFIPLVIWNKNAENVANYMVKGSMMGISGRLQIRSYDAKDGTKRYVAEVVVDEVQFLSKSNGQASNSSSGNVNNSYDYSDDYTPVNEGDIPF